MSHKRRADDNEDAASTRTVVYTPSQIQSNLLVHNEANADAAKLRANREMCAGQANICAWISLISERACKILDARLCECPPVGWLFTARNLVVSTHAFVPFEMKYAAISELDVAQSMVLVQRRISEKYAHLGYTACVTLELDDKDYPCRVVVQLAAELPPA
jgi:hypothetical protein